MYDPNATLMGVPQSQQQQRYPPGYDPNATLMGVPQSQQQQRYPPGYDPNATLMGAPQPQQQQQQQQQRYPPGYDPNATLMGAPPGYQPPGYDPNATLMGPAAGSYAPPGYDPNATLMGGQGYDPNATLLGVPGDGSGGDPNATLMGGGPVMGGGPMLVNNSAFVSLAISCPGTPFDFNSLFSFHPFQIHQQMNQQPTVLPHIKLVPHNGFFQIIDRDVLRTLKFGRTVRFFFFVPGCFLFSQWPPLSFCRERSRKPILTSLGLIAVSCQGDMLRFGL